MDFYVKYGQIFILNQCGGELADLDEDAIVKSIGMGNTDRLSSLNGLRQVPKDQEEAAFSNPKPAKLNIKVYKPKI